MRNAGPTCFWRCISSSKIKATLKPWPRGYPPGRLWQPMNQGYLFGILKLILKHGDPQVDTKEVPAFSGADPGISSRARKSLTYHGLSGYNAGQRVEYIRASAQGTILR